MIIIILGIRTYLLKKLIRFFPKAFADPVSKPKGYLGDKIVKKTFDTLYEAFWQWKTSTFFLRLLSSSFH